MGETPDGSNEGHFCPLCEFTTHYQDFDAREEITTVAKEMVAYAREENLIPQLS